MATWTIRPIRMPDSHLPHDVDSGQPACRSCSTAWPCETAGEYLSGGTCTCGALTFHDKTTPRRWHLGPRCYTDADVIRLQAAQLREARRPHYPPSHFYPPKPSRPVRQCPPYEHTPAGPGDANLGMWVWVRPGALHPGWGDIHRLAMVTGLSLPKCEVWLHCDGTVHQVRADLLILDRCGSRDPRPPAWTRWTVAEHLAHQHDGRPGPPVDEGAQLDLFAA
ncbi:hypothetical protein [Streptomyces afghaniensis]|uniref:hypothetical protein n=1 Tax=Streptomyces afghaniensis TaxID=66865 RepID=UPI00277F7787|nr:hypothetical protein [Streptomyces afghaniensis]MDQ1018894.1 hypothetical protein [Streptomyces afghaniensis]